MSYANPLYSIKAKEIRNLDFCTALVFSSQPTKCTPPMRLKSVKTDPKGLKTAVLRETPLRALTIKACPSPCPWRTGVEAALRLLRGGRAPWVVRGSHKGGSGLRLSHFRSRSDDLFLNCSASPADLWYACSCSSWTPRWAPLATEIDY